MAGSIGDQFLYFAIAGAVLFMVVLGYVSVEDDLRRARSRRD